MISTVVLAAAMSLAPAQAGELKLSNPRATYGVLGALRSDHKILPGDVYFLTFDIENLTTDAEGKILYSMGMELVNPMGQTEYKKDPLERPPLYNVLGGSRIPAFAHAQTGTETTPGIYTLKVIVIDRTTKKTASLERKFEVLKKSFGLVELSTSYDKDGVFSAPFGGMTGQSLFVNFWIVGFERGGKDMQPNITFEMSVLDESGKPTLPKPITGDINKDVPNDWQRLPMNFILPLNRAGKFKVQLKATDVAGKKKPAELILPITVVELK